MDEMEITEYKRRGAPGEWSLQQAGDRRIALLQLRADHSALRAEVAWLELLLAFKAAFNPNQPRVPAGRPDGGQWTDGDGDVIPVADSDRPGNDRYLNPHILRDHVGKSDAELVARMEKQTRRGWYRSRIMDRNGSFESAENARDLIRRTIDINHDIVERVARGQLPRAFITRRIGSATGREAYREPPDSDIIRLRTTYDVGVEIVHDQTSDAGYRIISAYPRNYNPRIGR